MPNPAKNIKSNKQKGRYHDSKRGIKRNCPSNTPKKQGIANIRPREMEIVLNISYHQKFAVAVKEVKKRNKTNEARMVRVGMLRDKTNKATTKPPTDANPEAMPANTPLR